MCQRKTGLIKVGFEISSHDLGAVLTLATRQGITSRELYRRAVAAYLLKHGDHSWWGDVWPGGDGTVAEDHGSAPMQYGQGWDEV